MGKERLERKVLLIGGREDHLRDRCERLGELRVLHVLQHDALAALFADHALVVRQVERGRLHAVVAVARGVNFVDDDDRRRAAESRVSVLWIDRQVVLDVLQFARELLQLRALAFVLDCDERLERRLRVEPLVFVHFVRPDGWLDRPFQIHPGHVAVVVVVREKRVGALRQKRCQRRLVRERRRLAQQRRRLRQLILVLDVVRNVREGLARAPHHGEESAGARAFGGRQRRDPPLDLLLRRAGRIKIRRLRLGRRAGHKRLVVIEARPGALIDQKIMQPRASLGRRVADQIEQHRLVPRPHLSREQRVDDLRRLHKLHEHLTIGRGQPRDIGRDVGRHEPLRQLVQPRRLVRCGWLRLGRVLGHRPLLGAPAETNRQSDNRSCSIHGDSVLPRAGIGGCQDGGWRLEVGG